MYFPALKNEIKSTLHSRELHRRAHIIYENPAMFDKIKRAWAVWMIANTSFNNSFISGFSKDKNGKATRSALSKIDDFSDEIAGRIKKAQIECRDALKIICENDSKNTFFYVDPPYVGACQGHYDGYTQEDFDALITTLSKIKGRFLLSSYRNKSLTKAVKASRWHQIELKINNCPSRSTTRTKIEVLTANYPITLAV